ncbi:hypothetical protein HID58_048767 [Brassica napus]|uniref:RRM domain-containing protein n=1 Tax=Brassica napus TaxID=3708 RepID=A0ABQ8B321_BRANA|nr:hypothetical protein HID58_048767 [Brassica napus]
MEEEKKVGEKRKRADEEVADTLVVSKEGFDDESKLLTTVFVGNLPLKAKKKVIFEGVYVNAYVVFETEEAAEASLAHNMSLIDGNHIRVDRACPSRKKLKGQDDHLSVVLISGLSCSIVINIISYSYEEDEEEVYQYLTANLVLKKGYLNLRDRDLVRASKSADDKKKPYQKSPAQSKMRPRSSSSSSSSNEGNKAGSSSNNSAVKQRRSKRKQESRTPDSFSKKKKPKRG